MNKKNTRFLELSPQKQALFEMMRKKRDVASLGPKTISPRASKDSAPLSFAQQQLWFMEQIQPASSLYNGSVAIQIDGPLNVVILEQSINGIIKRHEILRTAFVNQNGLPRQIIASTLELSVPLLDLSKLSEDDRAKEIEALINQDAQLPFDLSRGPLLRAKVLFLNEDNFVFLLTMHHIICDGWSREILMRELSIFYDAYINGKQPILSDLPVQYADYAIWQQQWLQGATLENFLSYWKKQLGGTLPILNIPTDYPQPLYKTYKGHRQMFTLPKELTKNLRDLSKQESVTLFIILLSALKALLHRYSGQTDILVSSPIANRNQAEIEGLIGFFVNVIVLRTDLSGDPSFRELIERIRLTALDAYANQDLPFEKLVEELQPRRGTSHTLPLKVGFAFQNSPLSAITIPGLTLKPLDVDNGMAQLDLTLFFWEQQEFLIGALEYSTELFKATTVKKIIEQFQTLLEGIVINPDQRISLLPPYAGRPLTPLDVPKDQIEPLNDNIYKHSNLTKNQILIWIRQRFQPNIPLYNIAFSLSISGTLNPDYFTKAFQKLINTNDALRIVIEEVNGVPQQRVNSVFPYTIRCLDYSKTSDPNTEARKFMQERGLVQFEFGKQLFNSALIKISDQRFIWYFCMHHILTDGWSMGLIIKYMAELYKQAAEDCFKRLDHPQFQDYIDYERESRSSPGYIDAELYWKNKLANDLEPIRFYNKNLQKQTTHVHRISYDLGSDRTKKLMGLVLREEIFLITTDVTLQNIFITVLFTYLYRISGNRQLSLGIPYHNRQSNSSKDSLGMFMEMLPLRVTIDDGETFLSLLGKVSKEIFETLEQGGQFAIGNPLNKRAYDVVMNFLVMNHSFFNLSEIQFQKAQVELEWLFTEHADDSLTLLVHGLDKSESIIVDFDFHDDVFSQEQRDQAIEHFINALDAFINDIDQNLCTVNLLSIRERHRILTEFNETKAHCPIDQLIPQIFENQTRKTPNRRAVVFKEQSLSYIQLNAKANQLARYLQSLGVGPDVLVGISVERSLEMVTGLLGILKAGGAYVPIDPDYPRERIALMLENAQVPILLTKEHILERLPVYGGQIVRLDKDWTILENEDEANLPQQATPDNLIYVIFTSGSTGRPKGAGVYHRGFTNLLHWFVRDFTITDQDRTLLVTSLSFDLTQKNIFTPLITGGELHLSASNYYDSHLILDSIFENRITLLNASPSAFYPLIEGVDKSYTEKLGSLRYMILGGEPISVPRLWPWINTPHFNTKIANTYGPTECTDISASYQLDHPEKYLETSVPIGVPISNVNLFILDENLEILPIGIIGELCITGIGVGKGYINDLDLTLEKFVPNPFSHVPGSLLYRTGDLARYLPDGNIEFLGRIDHQVKIRGFRVELVEIETVLGQHPSVQNVVVLVREDVPGDKRLVAFIVANQGFTPSLGDLRNFLQEKLPDYMVPSAFVLLDTMPLTPNGKVDRQGLLVLDSTKLELESSYIAPSTPLEETIAKIFAELLGVSRVGIYDDFFALGGHSLLATQLISRLRDTFNVEISVRSLFEAPTVAGLAVCISKAGQIESQPKPPPLVPVSRDGELPLSFAQQRLWFIDQLMPKGSLYNVPAAVQLSGSLNISALEQSLNEIIKRHDALRTSFLVQDGNPVQIIHPNVVIPLDIVNIDSLPDGIRQDNLQQFIEREAQLPFNLKQSPLIRTKLIRLSQDEYVLLITLHHIVADAWSMGLLLAELNTLYAAFSIGQSLALPKLPVQYPDYAAWQRQWLQGEVLDRQLAYWKQQLAGAPSALNLATDRPRQRVQSYNGAALTFSLSSSLSTALRETSHREGVTLFMTLLAVFKAMLSRYSGQDDIVVGTPVVNRNRAELESVIGFFLNTLVLRTDLSGNPSFRELLERIRKTALDAYTHQDLPFEKLVEQIGPKRDMSREPLFQVMFALQNAPLPKLVLPGLTTHLLEVDNKTAKYDLTLFITENEDGLLIGALGYNTDLFDDATIKRMFNNFQAILGAIVTNLDQRLSDLPFLTEAELYQVLTEWNNTTRVYPNDLCIHELFEAQAILTPEATAVRMGEQYLTYKELNSRANQLAHYLHRLGAGTETMVGVCLERSPNMVIGLLGILKAGSAYVPFDPTYPKDRLTFMLLDSQVPIIVTQENLLGKLPQHNNQVVCLDTDWDKITLEGDENLSSYATLDNVAYVIYTSGSTGMPKGVRGLHKGMINRFHWMWEKYPFSPGEICCQKTALSFIDSIWEIFGPLLQGVPIVIIPDAIIRDPYLLVETLSINKVTRIVLVPSLLRMLLGTNISLESKLSNLQYWTSSGEVLPFELYQRFQKIFPRAVLLNLYGSSEVSADATYFDTSQGCPTSCVPIGRPISNLRVYLLDQYLQPVPIGVVGEVYIGGAGLARDYLNKPDLTAERFIQDPFIKQENSRIYKSGDLARYLPDGNIEYCGRVDHQVKVRGFRIELGEVEATIMQHATIQECVVIAREDMTEDKQLVAYIVLHPQQSLTTTEIHHFLEQRIPEYMVPSVFIMLDALPLTPNGKVDRLKLPPPGTDRPQLNTAFAAPRTSLEVQLAEIWQQILHLEQVGINDNFFELGGHSLLAAQFISRVSSILNYDVPLATLFLYPTIASLAEALTDNSNIINRSTDLAESDKLLTTTDTPKETHLISSSPFLCWEQRPLLSLFATGKVAPVDSAELSYLSIPHALLKQIGISRDQLIQNWFDNLPLLAQISETIHGRIANIVLPRLGFELYDDQKDLVTVVIDALEMAGRVGARTVSLTGLLASATDYGRAVADAIVGRKDLPLISTGHATTTAAVVLAVQRILHEGGRDITQERMAFLGMGSIGTAVLRLMLRCLPHPKEILLCDLFSRSDLLEQIKEEILHDNQFNGSIHIVGSGTELPPQLYDATLIIGATSVSNILDIDRLQSGTIVVDDSAPHCFSPEQAIQRFQKYEDILFTEGGVLRSPDPIQELRYMPRQLEAVMDLPGMEILSQYNQFNIMGCGFSSLLSAKFDELTPTLGFVDSNTSLMHYKKLIELGFKSANLHCRNYELAEKSIQNFRCRFSANNDA